MEYIIHVDISLSCLCCLAKLTKSKSLPPSDDQIRKHKDQRRQLEKWRSDVKALYVILDKLKTEYESHKGDFALGRYEELKEMIKSAISQCRDAVKENSNHRYEPASSDRSGKIGSLCKNAASFAEQQEQVSSEEKRYSSMYLLISEHFSNQFLYKFRNTIHYAISHYTVLLLVACSSYRVLRNSGLYLI